MICRLMRIDSQANRSSVQLCILSIMLAMLLLLLDSRRRSVYLGCELFRCNIAARNEGEGENVAKTPHVATV